MTKETEYWTLYLASAVFVLTLYPVIKEFISNWSLLPFLALFLSGILALIFVRVGQLGIERELKKK